MVFLLLKKVVEFQKERLPILEKSFFKGNNRADFYRQAVAAYTPDVRKETLELNEATGLVVFEGADPDTTSVSLAKRQRRGVTKVGQSPHGRDGHAPFFRENKTHFIEALA